MNEIPSSNTPEEQPQPPAESTSEEKAVTGTAAQPTNPPTEYIQPVYAPQYAARPLKDRNIALVLEILPGLFGLYGFGWIYSGNTSAGIMILIGGLVWAFIVVAAAMLTATAACFCTVPVNIVAVALSAFFLNGYTKKHTELFG